jgi:hypothetical protein
MEFGNAGTTSAGIPPRDHPDEAPFLVDTKTPRHINTEAHQTGVFRRRRRPLVFPYSAFPEIVFFFGLTAIVPRWKLGIL